MKALLFPLLLWVLAAGGAPAPSGVQVKHLPATGLVLDSGWRYRAGDSNDWKRPGYPDHGWDAYHQHIIPASLLRTGRGWLRLRLQLGPALSQGPLLLLVEQAVASELYLDGQLLQRTGRFGNRPEEVRAYSNKVRPISLPITDQRPHVLAVRVALPPFVATYNSANLPPLFQVRVVGPSELTRVLWEQNQKESFYMVSVGMLVLLTLMHLVLLGYNPGRRANLYFAGYTACSAWIAHSLSGAPYLVGSVASMLALSLVHVGVLLLGLLSALRALYAAFELRIGWKYHGLALLVVSAAIFNIFPVAAPFHDNVIYGVLLLLTGEQVRVSYGAVRQGKRGGALVAAGFTINFITVTLAAAIAAGDAASAGKWAVPLSEVVDFFSKQFFLLGPAVALSLYLAREAALDRQLLQVKLAQVEELSAEAVAQQQEKQRLLAERNQDLETEVGHRTAALQASLEHLRRTQAQLVEHEKLASLGALTAGIAHEIQNPLNFVTNFADLSAELVTELEEQQQLPARSATEEADLLAGLKQNLHKIRLHGQRAAAIVRSMLEHSRPSTGLRGAVDLNALCGECLQLADEDQRAKAPAFAASLRTELAADLPPVAGVSADLSRVLLNLFTNALYAVRQRQQQGGPAGFVPTVHVATRCVGERVEVRVQDNGPGMSPAVMEKVFQPFFTTKPPGEGTGLGLSLAFDIVVQGHSGSLTVESQPGEGTTFCVGLPVAPA